MLGRIKTRARAFQPKGGGLFSLRFILLLAVGGSFLEASLVKWPSVFFLLACPGVFNQGQLGGGGEGGRFQSRRGSPLRSAFQSVSAFGSVWFRAQAGEFFKKGSGFTGPGHSLLHCLCPPVPKLRSFSACKAPQKGAISVRCLVAVALVHKTAMGSASELPILLPGAREHDQLKETSAPIALKAWRRAYICFRTLGRAPSNTELRQGPQSSHLASFPEPPWPPFGSSADLDLPISSKESLCEALDSLHTAYEELAAGCSRERGRDK